MSTTTEAISERVRPRLERLRKTLRHWQICSTEYETLRRELSTLPPKANREDMLAVGTRFSGKVVDEKEVKNLLGDEIGITRTVVQVLTEISHRIDYTQENVKRIEQQIEQGENEIDENEEEEDDEYEDEDVKYKPTAEGLVSPELRKELEEFRKRIKERGEAARAEEAKWIADEKQKPKKKRRGGVRFAEDPEEVPVTILDPLPLPMSSQVAKDTSFVAGDLLTIDVKHDPPASETAIASNFPVEDEDARFQYSIAQGERQSPKQAMPTPVISSMMCRNSLEPTSPQLPKSSIGQVVPGAPCSAPTPPPED